MCDIFPELKYCCVCCSLRVGLLFIAVASMISGALILGVLENDVDASYYHSSRMIQTSIEVAESSDMYLLYKHLFDFVVVVLTFHAWAFIVAGIFLLIADLTDESGFAQIFVWLTLINIVMGALALLVMGFDCIVKAPRCLMDMDWLETTFFIIMAFCFYAVGSFVLEVVDEYVYQGQKIEIDRFYFNRHQSKNPFRMSSVPETDVDVIFLTNITHYRFFYFISVANSYIVNGDTDSDY